MTAGGCFSFKGGKRHRVCRERIVAQALLRACEAWAREKGCAEFASDCELDNEASAAFHARVGFAEVNRIRCFLKPL